MEGGEQLEDKWEGGKNEKRCKKEKEEYTTLTMWSQREVFH